MTCGGGDQVQVAFPWAESVAAAVEHARSHAPRSKAAVFIFETRPHRRLPSLLLEALRWTPSDTPVIFAGTAAALAFCKTITVSSTRLLPVRVQLPPGKRFRSCCISQVLTRIRLYAGVRADYIVVLQTDGMVCQPLAPFFAFEWVGAPWASRWLRSGSLAWRAAGSRNRAHGGANGGMSVRSTEACLRLLRKHAYRGPQPEDVWFLQHGIKPAPFAVRTAFGCEQIAHTRAPATVHRPWGTLPDAELAALEAGGCPGLASLLRDNGASVSPLLARAEVSRLRAEMSRAITGQDRPLTCDELQALPKSDRWCQVQLHGRWCDSFGNRCVDLTGCNLNGSQRCGFFERCIVDPSYTVNDNSSGQIVTTCQTDGLRVATLALGVLLLVSLTLVLIAHYIFNALVVKGPTSAQVVRKTELQALMYNLQQRKAAENADLV